MSWPERITEGFNYDEAIMMCELCRRIYSIFSEDQDVERAREMYEALYYQDDWQFVHAICDAETFTRCLIVKRRNRNQYALVFRGTAFTSGAGVDVTAALGDMDISLVECGAVPGEALTPPRPARVHRGFSAVYQNFRDEIHFFLEILVQSRLDQKLLIDLVRATPEEQQSRIAVIGAAIAAQYGRVVGDRSVLTITRVVRQIAAGELDISKISFDALIAKGVGFHKYLEELVQGSAVGQAQDAREPLQVYITGHSLGGALSTLCLLDLKRHWSTLAGVPGIALKAYSVGSTHVGNQEFADYFNGLTAGFNFRIANALDPFVYMPGSMVCGIL